MSWVRLYVEILDDPKTAMLPDAQFRLFCECLCLAKIANKGGDTCMTVAQLDWRLRRKTGKNVEAMCATALLTMSEDGTVVVTQWAKRQFESDSSTDRVKKHRDAKKGNVPVTVDETLQEQSDAVTETPPESESDTDSEKTPVVPLAGDRIPFAEIVEAFNATMTGLPKVRKLDEARKRAIRKIWTGGAEYQSVADFWQPLFEECAEDSFLNGTGPYSNGHENWRPDFDYLIRPKTITKVYERAMQRVENRA